MKHAIVTGMIATYPVGGVVWDYAQYALALEGLGFEVYYLEDTGWETYDPRKGMYGEDCLYGVQFLEQSLKTLSPSLAKRWHFRDMHGKSYGLEQKKMRELAGEASLFLNVSNSCLLREEYAQNKNKILIDTDPGWNHFVNFPKWDKNPGWQGSRSWREHDHFFTYAERIGNKDCLLPDFGIKWFPTRPVVIPELWGPKPSSGKWTTVMTWDNFKKPIEYGGRMYGTKEMEFVKVEDLPTRTKAQLEVAAGGNGVPRDHWKQLGWSVIDSHSVSETAAQYRSYIESSRGEFSVAKNVYTATRSGWFSCRTICYLAAGRPAVIQDTGFSENIPTGKGLFAFHTATEALDAIEIVEKNYEMHQRAAKEMAVKYFSPEVVLGKLLQNAEIR